MAKKHAKALKLTGKTCRLGKISNNLERHGDEHVTAFTIPITDVMLTKTELIALMRDASVHESWYAPATKTQAAEPRPWWNGERFKISETFEADAAALVLLGDREIEFESTGDPKDDDYRPAAVISKITLTPHAGGLTELCASLYVRPGIGKTNLTLQTAQHSEAKLTITGARVAERDKAQPQLPLDEGGPAPSTEAKADDGATAAATH